MCMCAAVADVVVELNWYTCIAIAACLFFNIFASLELIYKLCINQANKARENFLEDLFTVSPICFEVRYCSDRD